MFITNKQITLATAGFERYSKTTRRAQFLDEMDRVIPFEKGASPQLADRWLSNDRAAALRARVGTRFAIAHVEALDGESAFYSPKTRRRGTPPRCHPVGIVLGPVAAGGSVLSSIAIHPGRSARIDIGPTLADVAHVRIAPWLGTRGVFVVDAAVAAVLPLDHLVPVIGPKELQGGVLRPSTRFAIRTTIDVEPVAAVRDHLLREGHRMCERRRVRLERWAPPETFERFPLDQAMLVVPRIERDLRAIRVEGGVLPIDQNLCVISAGAWSLDDLQQLLESAAARAWIRERADRLERGYFSIKTRVLSRLPVSSVSAPAVAA